MTVPSLLEMPALLGGPAVRPQGPPTWPFPDHDVYEALQAAYQDGSWGKYHGNYTARLEERLARYHEIEFALTCGSGTFAVELALRALKIGPGDEVILAAYDYPGNFLSVHAVGARPVLVDVAPNNWNLAPDRLTAAIGPATRAVIVSHLHGGIVPMREVMTIAAAHGLRVVEDAAQMPGAVVQGRKAGTWGDAGILSFGGSKLLSAGRGGALLTRHADIHQRARLYLHRSNHLCPLSELQAAVLLPQLDKLDTRNVWRTQSVRRLQELLQDIPGMRMFVNAFSGSPSLPAPPPDAEREEKVSPPLTPIPEAGRGEQVSPPSFIGKEAGGLGRQEDRGLGQEATESHPGYYKVGFQFDSTRFGLSRDRFIAAVRAEGIALDEGFRALHVGRSPNRYRRGGDLTEAERAHHGCIVLHHPVLLGTPAEIEEVALAVRKVYAYGERLKA